MSAVEIAQVELVLSAARRRSHEILSQASGYSVVLASKTMIEHYHPLKAAIDLVEATTLTPAEIDALLWAVRAIPLEPLREAQAARRFGEGTGYGALSSGTNKIERLLGTHLRPGEESS